MSAEMSDSPSCSAGTWIEVVFAGTGTSAVRSRVEASASVTVGPPYGQPEQSVTSMRRPSLRPSSCAYFTSSSISGDRKGRFLSPLDGSSSTCGYSNASSAPWMPSAFICCNSRRISGFTTASPNHHQRTMGLAAFGGLTKPVRSVPTDDAGACAASAGATANGSTAAMASAAIGRRVATGCRRRFCCSVMSSPRAILNDSVAVLRVSFAAGLM